MHIPFAFGLLDQHGNDVALRLEGEATAGSSTRVLELTRATQSYRFIDVPPGALPSLLRNFSAPVSVEYEYDDAELTFLSAHDADPFNRWEAGQRLAMARLLGLTDATEAGRTASIDDAFIATLRATLTDQRLSPAFKAQALMLPEESLIGDCRRVIEPQAIRTARLALIREIGARLAGDWRATYDAMAVPEPYSPDPLSAGRRALRNLALSYLVFGEVADSLDLARVQLIEATNMSDAEGALTVIVNSNAPYKAEALVQLARLWCNEPLLMNKWYQLQATAIVQLGEPPGVERVTRLMNHPGFSLANPNNAYALIRSFCIANEAEFHRRGADGYGLWMESVLALDAINPTVAARVARALERWRRYAPDRQAGMRAALEAVAAQPRLSRDVREIVTKAIN